MEDKDIIAEIFRKRFYVFGALAGVSAFAWGTSHIALQNYVFHSTTLQKMGHPFNIGGVFKDVSVKNHLQMFLFLNTRYLVMEKTNRKKNLLRYLLSTSLFTLLEYPLEAFLHRVLISKHQVTNGKFFDLKGYFFKLSSHFVYDGVYHLLKWTGCKLLGLEEKERKFHNQILSVFGYEEKGGKILLTTDEDDKFEEGERDVVQNNDTKLLFGVNENIFYGLICVLASTLGTVCAHPFRVLTIRRQCRDEDPNFYDSSVYSDGVLADFVGSSVSKGFFMGGVIPVLFVNICLNSMAKAASLRVDRFKRDLSQIPHSEYEKKKKNREGKNNKQNEKKTEKNRSNDDDDDNDVLQITD